MAVVTTLLMVLFTITVLLLLLLVIVQHDSSGGGLGGVFGGSSASAFGSRTGTVLSKATYVLLVTFFVLTLTLGFLFSSRKADSGVLTQGAALDTSTPWVDNEPLLETSQDEALPETSAK